MEVLLIHLNEIFVEKISKKSLSPRPYPRIINVEF